jgi:hypothetical protein
MLAAERQTVFDVLQTDSTAFVAGSDASEHRVGSFVA